MASTESFNRLAQRDSELAALAARGRRRALALMIAVSAVLVLVIAKINGQAGVVGVMPVVLGCYGGIAYSWSKWRRHPEDTQVIAFVGLSRTQRREAYASVRRSRPINDPVVRTVVEAMHHHVQRSIWVGVAFTCVIAASFVGLFVGSNDRRFTLAGSIGIGALAALAILVQLWITKRVGRVLAAHMQPE